VEVAVESDRVWLAVEACGARQGIKLVRAVVTAPGYA
jgi:hypothetical protein